MKCCVQNCYQEFSGPSEVNKHLSEFVDDIDHFKFFEFVVRQYKDELLTPMLIKERFGVHENIVKYVLNLMKVKIRGHIEAVAIAMQENRQNINAYGNGRYRKDLNHYFRSNPEANFARILKYERIEYEYEVRFELFNENKKELVCTYTLDFLMRKFNQGVEIKGYQSANGDFKNRPKILLFKKQHPEIKLKVLFADSKEWKDLRMKYKSLIDTWEE
jgi:hypothetical protein